MMRLLVIKGIEIITRAIKLCTLRPMSCNSKNTWDSLEDSQEVHLFPVMQAFQIVISESLAFSGVINRAHALQQGAYKIRNDEEYHKLVV